ncbi:hypothetical protein EB118_08320 [bacterium]|nr:hypothetical protein [bacterium]NDC94868.1 hypothetical protein [bacterium]NDD84611.1 hypothetical protein [bacterium]NDG30071.1 hypothetical protein [bacterium]
MATKIFLNPRLTRADNRVECEKGFNNNERVFMNDAVLFGSIFTVVVAAVCAFAWFHVYRGVHDSLSNAKVGSVYNFKYLQPVTDVPERFMAKVISVQTFTDDYLGLLNRKSRYRRNDPEFQRSRNLVTAQTFDGKIRNFYAERTSDVRRPLLGAVVFKTGLANLLF